MGDIDLSLAEQILLALASPFLLVAFGAVMLVGVTRDAIDNLKMNRRGSRGDDEVRIRYSVDHELLTDDSKFYHQLYRYASEGREAAFTSAIGEFKTNHDQNAYTQLLSRLSPFQNTFLHTAVCFGHSNIAFKVMELHPPLLKMKNFEGDTALHIAAKLGAKWNENIGCVVEDLIRLAENYGNGDMENDCTSLLMMKNDEDNTALHEAVINGHELEARHLIEADPSVCFKANKENKSPLYLATEAGLDGIAMLMIERTELLQNNVVGDQGASTTNSVELVLEGKSLLHAAILGRNIGVLRNANRQLTLNSEAEKGRNPLHIAASTGYLEGVRFLLQKCLSDAHQADNSGAFPIHYASSKGYVDIVKVFLERCPDSKELRNSSGENILHVAAKFGRDNVVKYLLKNSEFKMLINQKDKAGNTPLHLATIYRRPAVVNILTWDKRTNLKLLNARGMTALDAAESTLETIASFHGRLTWIALKSSGTQRAQSSHILLRKNGQNAQQELLVSAIKQVGGHSGEAAPKTEDLIAKVINSCTTGSIQLELPNKESVKDRVNTLLVVTTLIATVSFAAGFTMPGGYNNSGPHEGIATLLHKRMFQIFVICNGIAMYSSVVVAVTLIWAQLGDLSLVHSALRLALPLLGIALTMLSLAFMAGVFVVVSSLYWLANAVLIMGGVFLFTVLALFIPLFFPTTSTSRVLRYITYYPFRLAVLASGSHNTNLEED